MWFLSKYKKWILLGALCHLLAVIFSEGFDRPDEHLGIIRWMSYQMDILPKDLLSWEFPAKIRPWLQPLIYAAILSPLRALGLENPFHYAFILRFFSSTLAFVSTVALARYGQNQMTTKRWKDLVVPMTLLLWFLPFFHARTTAENFGITFFVFGFVWIMQKPNFRFTEHAGFGALMALSFIFRFQQAFMIAPFVIWLFVYKKCEWRDLIPQGLGFLLTILASTGIDAWAYGEWTFTPWNYFYWNIIQGKAAGFGTSPWYYYFDKVLMRGGPPLSLLFLIPPFWLAWKNPKHPLVWVVLPYFVVHSLLSHKEVRFMYALGAFVPILAAQFLEWIEKRKNVPGWAYKFLIFENVVLLLAASLRPAYSNISFYRHLYYERPEIRELTTLNLVRDELIFYEKHPVDMNHVKDFENFELTGSGVHWILTDKIRHYRKLKKEYDCQLDYASYPIWLIKEDYLNWTDRATIWTLMKCRK